MEIEFLVSLGQNPSPERTEVLGAELKSFSTASSDVLELTGCQAARALDLRSAMFFFVGKDNGFILDPDATRSLRTQVRD